MTAAGAERIYGLSSQSLKSQRATVERLHLPYPLLADPGFSLADALSLPTFSAPGHNRLYSRLTLVAEAGRIEKAFYPIFPPDRHADELLTWLHENL